MFQGGMNLRRENYGVLTMKEALITSTTPDDQTDEVTRLAEELAKQNVSDDPKNFARPRIVLLQQGTKNIPTGGAPGMFAFGRDRVAEEFVFVPLHFNATWIEREATKERTFINAYLALPPEMRVGRDPKTGVKYYYNETTGNPIEPAGELTLLTGDLQVWTLNISKGGLKAVRELNSATEYQTFVNSAGKTLKCPPTGQLWLARSEWIEGGIGSYFAVAFSPVGNIGDPKNGVSLEMFKLAAEKAAIIKAVYQEDLQGESADNRQRLVASTQKPAMIEVRAGSPGPQPIGLRSTVTSGPQRARRGDPDEPSDPTSSADYGATESPNPDDDIPFDP
jgi:hypothetical protein